MSDILTSLTSTVDTTKNATNLQNELSNLGNKISIDNIEGMLNGNFSYLTSNGLSMLSKAGISADTIEQFKNKPTAILDSVMTSVDEKIESVKNPQKLLSNLSSNLNINFSDMLANDNFKSVMSQAGIGSDVLDKVDLTNVKSLDDLKTELNSVLPTDALSKIENLGGMDSLLEKATGGMDGLIKNFSIDKIKNTASSEISDKVPTNILSRFIS